MPYHRNYIKGKSKKYKKKGRPQYRKGIKKRQYFRRSKGITQQIVPFQRTTLFAGPPSRWVSAGGWLEQSGLTTGPRGIVKTMTFKMSDLTGTTDFQGLFKMYKINAVRIEITPATNNTMITNSATNDSNSGLFLRIKKNQTGTLLTDTDILDNWLQNQAVKKFRIPTNKKTVLYMPVNQLAYVYRGPFATSGGAYGVTRPKWIETIDLECLHYGLDCRIDTISGTHITALYNDLPAYTIEQKYYFQCKGIK